MDFAEIVRKQGKGNSAGSNEKSGSNTKQWSRALCVKTIDAEKRQIRVLASSADLDRDGERVLPTAFKKHLSVFLSNPVILAAHQHRLEDGSPSVVGRAEKVWIENTGLWCIIKFAETDLAEKFWQLYRDGFMKAVSIGFAPIAWHDSNENGKSVRIFEEVELYEISLVAVPSNRAALSKSQQRKADWLGEKQLLKDPEFRESCDDFSLALLGFKEVDGELVKTDEFDTSKTISDDSEAAVNLAKTVNPAYRSDSNPLLELVRGRQ